MLDGLAAGQSASGVDLGASENPVEPTLAAKPRRQGGRPAGTEGVAAEMEAAGARGRDDRPRPAEAQAEEAPAVADEAAKEATSDANDAVETEKPASLAVGEAPAADDALRGDGDTE